MKIDSLELKHIAKHLPYGLKCYGMGEYEDADEECEIPKLFTVTGTYTDSNNDRYIEAKDRNNEMESIGFETDFFPLMFHLSAINQEITVNGETFIPIDCFEIGDDESGPEFDHGNIKLIKDLESISEYNCHNDINYLPFAVVQKLIEWHFDIDNLIENKLAIDVTTLKENPYK